MAYANWDQNMQQGQTNADIARWNFNQQQPYDKVRFQSEIYGMNQPQQSSGGGNPYLGGMGGAMMGYNMFAGMPGGYPDVPMVNQPAGNVYVDPGNYDWSNLINVPVPQDGW
jgi:hypothetical protein